MSTIPPNKSHIGYVLASDFIEGIRVRITDPEYMRQLRIGQLLVIEQESHDSIYAQVENLHTDWHKDIRELNMPSGVPTKPSLMQKLFIEHEILLKAVKVNRSGTLLAMRSIPLPGNSVRFATDDDISQIYGPKDAEHIYIGEPLEMTSPVVMNVKKFVERSNGIFGKSGTGKSFLARIILSELIRSQKVATLIFDMHSEYGWESMSEQGHIKGLRQLFPQQVLIFTLDEESSKLRGVQPDHVLKIAPEMITIDDIAMLADELDLSQAMLDAMEIIYKKEGKNWLRRISTLNPMDIETQAQFYGVVPGSLQALYRKLNRIMSLPFLKEGEDTLSTLCMSIESAKTVVLEFGHYNSLVTYMLVSNLITRHLHNRYVKATEKFINSRNIADKPVPLMIVVEEAHKFLQGRVARNTTFGTIAREMRKYSVTLLIIDQRPSSIDREVLSQLGTRIVAMLNDPDDIDAVFTGVSDRGMLKNWLATLDTKKQVLLLGHAIPIPTVVRVREYGEEFYRSMITDTDKGVKELFG